VAAVTQAHSQGTIAFGDPFAARVIDYDGALLPTSVRVNFGVFWGTSVSNLELNDGPLGTSSTAGAGINCRPWHLRAHGEPRASDCIYANQGLGRGIRQ
jgi:hypothetical protein